MESTTFINEVKDGAIEGWKSNKILPSISIAQAILESGWGSSELARNAHNLFGVKASSDWKGETYQVRTAEYRNNGTEKYYIFADFRKYNSWNESIKDHSKFFTSSPDRVERYKHVVGETDYKKAAKALGESGYATSGIYGEQILDLIERYKLYQYDEIAKGSVKGMKIFLSVGHSILKGGGCTSASGYVNEYRYNKALAPYVKAELEKLGHTCDVIVCPEYKFSNWKEERSYKLPIANSGKYDLVCELHLNASNGQGNGSEVLYYGDNKGKVIADRGCQALAELGFKNRGPKVRKDLYIIGATNPVAVLFESFFCDNKHDTDLAIELGYKKIAKAIAYALTGQTPREDTPVKPVEQPKPTQAETKKVFDIVLYDNEVDKAGAEFITQSLHIPNMSLTNYNKVKDKYKSPVFVGGKNAPSEAFVIAGKDRDETIDLVQKFVKTYR